MGGKLVKRRVRVRAASPEPSKKRKKESGVFSRTLDEWLGR